MLKNIALKMSSTETSHGILEIKDKSFVSSTDGAHGVFEIRDLIFKDCLQFSPDLASKRRAKCHCTSAVLLNFFIIISADHALNILHYDGMMVSFLAFSFYLMYSYLTNTKSYDLFNYREIYVNAN